MSSASRSGEIASAAPGDRVMIALAAGHAVILLMAPTAPVIALGLWWNSNTVSHNFIHHPFFRRPSANRLFGIYLSLLVGIPQALWRDRHLAHHAGVDFRPRLSVELALQAGLLLLFWAAMAIRAPMFLLSVYLPGYIAGLALCALHGYYEHAGGAVSHYGKLYNLLFLNDGYHVEHHARPETHWTGLPQFRAHAVRASAWPAPLRWMEAFTLQALERLVLRSRPLQRFVLESHRRALRTVVAALPPVDRVAIVGGGLFPRTALILRELLPAARVTIIDANGLNLEQARKWLAPSTIEFVHARYSHARHSSEDGYDLVVIPLSFDGNRRAIYERPPAPTVIVHDWIWRKRGVSRVVSVALLKRINLLSQ